MSSRGRDPPIDFVTLAELLTTLGSPVRLQLLQALRFPHTLGELEIRPHRTSRDARPDRTVARQTVQGHLDRLVEKGLVRVDEVQRSGRTIPSYTVAPARVYALVEDLRALTTMYAGRGVGADPTGTLDETPDADDVKGPRLVLVHGVYEGKAFLLERLTRGDEGWTIGRRKGLPITLDYDPYVSMEHAIITEKRGRFTVTDLGSKNGISINWRLVPLRGSRVLGAGDVIGVGRSFLSFIPD